MSAAIMTTKIEECEKIIGYHFQNSHIACEALQMAGSGLTVSGSRVFPNGNKRLAILGDNALEIILCQQWYEGGKPKGEWTALLQRIGTNANMGQVGLEHGLSTCIKVDPANVSPPSANMLATTVEALIGAAFLDGGLEAAKVVMISLGLLETEKHSTSVTFRPFSDP